MMTTSIENNNDNDRNERPRKENAIKIREQQTEIKKALKKVTSH